MNEDRFYTRVLLQRVYSELTSTSNLFYASYSVSASSICLASLPTTTDSDSFCLNLDRRSVSQYTFFLYLFGCDASRLRLLYRKLYYEYKIKIKKYIIMSGSSDQMCHDGVTPSWDFDSHYDVLVAGGGASGLFAAYRLVKHHGVPGNKIFLAE